MVLSIFHSYSSKQEGILLTYIKLVKSSDDIGLPKTCGYQNCNEETGVSVRSMFAQSTFSLSVLHKILHPFLWGFSILTVCLYWKEI